ncbi:MAG TPA: CCA tRNA nucleotidyltransferase [Verrucomicrobiae bacterium]|jgi:poly(A) polymerase|nr:CCA tRNA nucleotidyltransferase [Verrucomicrobiae bacterium]
MTAGSPKDTAKRIVARLQKAGFAAFWVGGCVRDFLLGREPWDIDIATNARPEQIEGLFKRTIAVGKKFGVIFVIENEHEFQVATFRSDEDYQDGRRPQKVVFGDARADALRRDFTINALFYDPISNIKHDWVGGQDDLQAKIIRTIGKPEERFGEDHLRLLRAIRFAAQLNFEIEANTFTAVKKLARQISLISAERIRDELLKLFRPPHAARGLDLLRDSGLMEHVLPELTATVSCAQSPNYHPEGSVFNHIRLMLEQLPPDAPASLPWAAILHDIGKPPTASVDEATGAIHFYGHEKVGADMARRILNRLRFPKKATDEIVACVRQHMQFKDVKQMRKATLRRLIMRETFPLEMQLHKLDCLGSHRSLEHFDFLVEQAKELKKKPRIRPPLLTGNDLIALGMKPGPGMGALLHEIRDKQLAEELKTKRAAMAWAKEQLKGKMPDL